MRLLAALKSALRRPAVLTVLCLAVCLAGVFAVQGCSVTGGPAQGNAEQAEETVPATAFAGVSLDAVPPYDGELYIEIENNIPSFTEDEITDVSFESYAELDSLGRCGTAFACLSRDTMPARGESRGEIYMIYPTGWEQNFYDFVDREALYNRCHLIAWKLSAENANERNLITGTRTMNTEGMGPFEDMVTEYIRETGNHVMYRVTPVFEGDNLVASGVHMEAYSVEDGGAGIAFNVYCYNVEPGVRIDYATGENREA